MNAVDKLIAELRKQGLSWEEIDKRVRNAK